MIYEGMNTKLHYECIGDGKPVVILHGLGCSLEMMKACLEPVFQTYSQYQRIYIDLPGMGKSAADKEMASSESILELLCAFINDLVKAPFLLIGESYGGYLAAGILFHYKKRIDGLMLLCPVIYPDHRLRTVPEQKTLLQEKAYLDMLNADERNSFCEYAVIANKAIHERYKKEIVAGLKQADDAFIKQLKQHYAYNQEFDDAVRNIYFDKPVLLICGRQDACVGYQDCWQLIENYPRATFALIDMAGHNLQIEQPELFVSLTKNWLQRVHI